MEPVISIVVLTYNIEDLVIETLDSIYAQTYKHIELIVSDDCSTDSTAGRCADWILKNRERFVDAKVLVAETNSGIPGNCNQGIRVAKGDWIKIIAGDDMFFPDAMEIFVNEIRKDSLLEKLVYHGNVVEYEDGFPIIIENKWGDPSKQNFNLETTSAEEQFKILLRFNPVFAPTVLVHKSVYAEIGMFDERFKFWEDRPMWIKMTTNGIKLHYVNSNLVKYRRHGLSVQMKTDQTLFSRTQISMDKGFPLIILPYLPFNERALHIYLISIRKIFQKSFKNRKTLIINIMYKTLSILPEKVLNYIKARYAP